MAWPTALEVLNAAAIGAGLVGAPMDDAYGSTDPAIVQLRQMLTDLGQDLVRERFWSHLEKTQTLATVAAQSAYDLPSDFQSMRPSSQWNRTLVARLAGPLSDGQWAELQARTALGTAQFYFRLFGNQLNLAPTPTGTSQSLSYVYRSAWWVRPTAQTAPTTDEPTANTDSLQFDKRVLVSGLKHYWLSEKGFDTTASEKRYLTALANAKSQDGLSPVLRVSGGAAVGPRMLGEENIPETGYGS